MPRGAAHHPAWRAAGCVIGALLLTGCRTLESAARQKGHGETMTFQAAYPRVFEAALQTMRALRLTVVGQNQQEGYIWASRRPEPMHAWELIPPTPRLVRTSVTRAVAPGQHVAIYFYPLDQERVMVEVIDQRISPVGMDRLLKADIFAGIARQAGSLPPTPAAP